MDRREPFNLDVHNVCDVKKVLQYASEIYTYHADLVRETTPFASIDSGRPWQIMANILHNAGVDISRAEKKGWIPKAAIPHLRVPNQKGIE